MKKLAIFLVLAFLGISYASAQDEIIYDQYHWNYYFINPALAGAEPCHHFTLTNKMQFTGMDRFPMTQLFSYKTRVWKNVGIGAYVFHDRNGFSNKAGGEITLAYHIPLSSGRKYSLKTSYDRQLSFGVSFKFNYFYISNDLFQEDPSAAEDVAFANTQGWAPNANFGIYYQDNGGFVGLTLTNLVPISADLYGEKEMPAPFTGMLFGGYDFDLGPRKDKYIEPMVLLKMNQYLEVGMDLNLKYGQEVSKKWGYWVQLSYRHSWNQNNIQAMKLQPMCGFRIGGFNIGYAFGLDLSNIVTQNYGTHEIMIGYSFCHQKHFCR